eukprot:4212749-Ditylum_brightwellii.AAC.1
MVLAAVVGGIGKEDLANLLTFLDLSHPRVMRRVTMPCIKDDIEGFEEEIKMILKENHQKWDKRRATIGISERGTDYYEV